MLLDYEVLIELAWWALVGVLLIGFAITDGMDMGVGNLLPFLGKNDAERRIIINTVGPHWDGNQVWFITAGGAIFAAWPAVYAAAFSGFYLAMLLVLFALFFRPVGFDYRSKIDNLKWRNAWDWGLFAGGFIPSLIFGVAFGNLLQGVTFHLDEFLRVSYDASFIWALLPLLNPFAILAGLVSVAMLTGHGSTWLQMRADLSIAKRAQTMGMVLGVATSALFALAGLWIWIGNFDYFVIVSQPPLDALPNPLAKEVAMQAGCPVQYLSGLSDCHAGSSSGHFRAADDGSDEPDWSGWLCLLPSAPLAWRVSFRQPVCRCSPSSCHRSVTRYRH